MATSFSQSVLSFIQRIPAGKVMTYGQVAASLGNPNASRAVGNALNKNDKPVAVSCHRVIRSDGDVGGYAFGRDKKINILETEGVVTNDGKISLARFQV